MKKKILSLIFAICLILPCAFIFSACDDKPEPIMHTVTFVYDNGTENSTTEIEEGKFITKPTDPNKTGYSFAGWYVGDFKWNFELVAVMNDVTLTAKWTEIPTPTYYSVKFMVDDVQFGETQTIESGSKATCPETTPTKTGYDFDGWYLGEEKWSFNLMPVTQNIELTAHWIETPTPATYTVTFVYDNGTENSTIQVEEGKFITKPTDPSKTGFNFAGWFIDDFKWDFELVAVMQNVTLTAHWSAKPFDVTFVYDNGDENQVITYHYGDKIIEPQEPSKTHYTFTGWFDGETEWDFDTTTITGATTLTAKWVLTNYQLTYHNVNGITNNNPSTYTFESETIVLADLVDPFYNFMGWYDNADFNGNAITEITKGSFGNKDLYAKIEWVGEISTVEQLKSIREFNRNYKLMNDIRLNYIEWTPIANNSAFSGTFDGNGYMISEFNITTGRECNGFFAKLSPKGVIKNLRLENYQICYSYDDVTYCGAVVGYVDGGKIDQCYCRTMKAVSLGVTSTKTLYVGGMVGYNDTGDISNCQIITSNIEATLKENTEDKIYAGGLVGYSFSTSIWYSADVENCFANVGVNVMSSSDFACAGGLIGYTSDIVNNCFTSTVVVKAIAELETGNEGSGAFAGGLFGQSHVSLHHNCYRRIYKDPSDGQIYITATQGSGNGQICEMGTAEEIAKIKEIAQNSNEWDHDIWDFTVDGLICLKIFLN